MSPDIDYLFRTMRFKEYKAGYYDIETGKEEIDHYEVEGVLKVSSKLNISKDEYDELYQKNPEWRNTIRMTLADMVKKDVMKLFDISNTDFQKLSLVRMIPIDHLFRFCKKYESIRRRLNEQKNK